MFSAIFAGILVWYELEKFGYIFVMQFIKIF